MMRIRGIPADLGHNLILKYKLGIRHVPEESSED